MTTDPLFLQVLSIVSSATDVPESAIMAKKRGKEHVAFARHMLCHVMRDMFRWGFRRIGEQVGRNHVSILHSCRFIMELPQYDRRRRLLTSVIEAVKIRCNSDYRKCVGLPVVLQSISTGRVIQTTIEDITPIGDGVLMRVNGEPKAAWTSIRDWMVIKKLAGE